MKTNHPIIVIEGADATGKTTLAQGIGGHYLHATYSKDISGRMTDYHVGLLDAATQLAEFMPVVIDRWRMSEIVYGNVFRDGPEDPELTNRMYNYVANQGGTFVCCHVANKEAYIEHFEKIKSARPEMFDDMNKVYDEYTKQIDILKKDHFVILFDILHGHADTPAQILAQAYRNLNSRGQQ